MNEQQIRTEVSYALRRLGPSNTQDRYSIVFLMKDAYDAIGKGSEGKDTLRGLIGLWQDWGFGEVSADTITEFRTRVDRSNKNATMSAVCAAVDKGDFGARAVNGLRDLWRELKLRQIDEDAIVKSSSLVNKMYEQLEDELRMQGVM